MPNRRLDTYFYHHKLDVDKMKQAASYLVGEHDFKSFCAVGAQVKTTTRTIYSCEVEKDGNDIVTIRVTGNGFIQYGTHYRRNADPCRRRRDGAG